MKADRCYSLYIRIVLLATLFFVTSRVLAQQEGPFLSNMANVINKIPAKELVYLHLDKSNYSFSDTIWYKAYVTIGYMHQPSALSGVLYVELISPKDSLIARQTVRLISGIGWSDIPLRYSLPQGTYRIRAYTQWMENFDKTDFYDQPIRIGGVALRTCAVPFPGTQIS